MPTLVGALARSTHPGPTVAVTTIAVLLGVGVGVEPPRLLLLGLAVLANQVSVGLSNDWIDADRDRAVGRADKPIARGWVSVRTVRTAAWVSAATSLVLTVPLGVGAWCAQFVFIASAWAYNAGLKATAFSVVPYIVSFGLLPVLVTQSLTEPAGAAWWAVAVGALLGIAAHFANVLPDLDDDKRTGIRGLPHRLGRVAAGITTYVVLAAASVVVVSSSGIPVLAGGIGLALNLAIAAVGITLVITRPPSRLLFQLIMAAALLNVALLVLAGDHVAV
ncbi:4-hydroxybenzoate polyprenyltransferase [Glaciihabitans tibetensis]|uniref:4-hydroxybenzoate polyprenyltransferase n=1 Tax=Glaciihabitans tibetensis TaxID=1266600 RepID=A0A2T0VIZ1_9MICO|nr:UbiA family prenyltransferase [Glaciihabitans tibetensis]PRY70173.1 4-hydroxybenzoate polyprenyltransferase [Glaciihabitans tibetensis]